MARVCGSRQRKFNLTYRRAATSAEELADLLAQHWAGLVPGPDPELEAAAEAKYHVRIREFARQFIALCGGVLEQRSPA